MSKPYPWNNKYYCSGVRVRIARLKIMMII